jgi:IS5 family transposase
VIVTPTAPEVNELAPVIGSIGTTLDVKPEAVIADAGYWSEESVRRRQKNGIEGFIATVTQKHGENARAPRGTMPKASTIRERMARKLRTRSGSTIYWRRKVLPEPVFGQIKKARGLRQFLRRGIVRVSEECALVCTAHNLLKLHTALKLV